jgi:hypothetical protein
MSTIPSKEEIIGKDENQVTYRITAFTGIKSINLCGKVVKMVGPSVSEFFNESEDSLTNAVKVFSQSLGDEDLAPLIKEMLSGVTIEGRPVNIDFDFIGPKFSHLPKLLVSVAMFNWGDMFREIEI